MPDVFLLSKEQAHELICVIGSKNEFWPMVDGKIQKCQYIYGECPICKKNYDGKVGRD